MDGTNIKKFLIISSYAPPAISGAPLMMYNLLHYFPENSFIVLTSHAGIQKQNNTTKKLLNTKYFFFDSPILNISTDRDFNFIQRLKRFIKNFWFMKFIVQFFILFYTIINIIRIGAKVIKRENIKLLLAYSDYGPTLLSTYILHKITKIPFYLYFYDLYYGSKLPVVFKIIARLLEPRLFKDAQQIFVTNEELQKYYQNKYKKSSVVIYNSIPIKYDNKKPVVNTKRNKNYNIVYTGTIYWAQLDAIQNLIKGVNKIKQTNIKLFLYTPHDKNYLNKIGIFENKKIKFKSGSPEEMSNIQNSADILFAALGFKTKYSLLINTSSPGKTYEYMASGKPILIHAPKDSYIAKYAKKYNFACVVDENNVKMLKEAILKLIQDKEYAIKIVNNARQVLYLNHDAFKNFKKFAYYFKNKPKKIYL